MLKPEVYCSEPQRGHGDLTILCRDDLGRIGIIRLGLGAVDTFMALILLPLWPPEMTTLPGESWLGQLWLCALGLVT